MQRIVTSILIVGQDAALLEGVSQTFIGSGYKVIAARDTAEAFSSLRGSQPLVALVHSEELVGNAASLSSILSRGGALIAFHCDDEDKRVIPFKVKRSTLAELSLPLERHRLLALISHVESRARAAGRESADGDPADSAVDAR